MTLGTVSANAASTLDEEPAMNDTHHPEHGRAQSRRRFLQLTGAAAASLACVAPESGASAAAAETPVAPKSPAGKTLEMGVASYTFRKFDLAKTLAMTKRTGLKHICLKSFHLPLDATPEQLAAAAKQVADAGLALYAGGVITMTKEDQVNQAFDYAKGAGMKMIIAAPSGEMLPAIEQKAKQYDIAIAIHNHGPGDKHFPTPESAYEKIKSMDRRMGLCIDIGHTVRIGADPVQDIEKFADRLLDFHMKDVTQATAKGQCIQCGRGVIDLPAVIRALVKVKYGGVVAYEYEIEENDPLPGLAESVGYTRGVLAAL
jgi:sugar phosphate isomerase/epimerase